MNPRLASNSLFRNGRRHISHVQNRSSKCWKYVRVSRLLGKLDTVNKKYFKITFFSIFRHYFGRTIYHVSSKIYFVNQPKLSQIVFENFGNSLPPNF